MDTRLPESRELMSWPAPVAMKLLRRPQDASIFSRIQPHPASPIGNCASGCLMQWPTGAAPVR
jgi:hypothetical protein